MCDCAHPKRLFDVKLTHRREPNVIQALRMRERYVSFVFISLKAHTAAVITPLTPTQDFCYPASLRVLRRNLVPVCVASSICHFFILYSS